MKIYFLCLLSLYAFFIIVNADGGEGQICGNGVINAGETCDLGAFTGYYVNNTGTCCSANCQLLNSSYVYKMFPTCTVATQAVDCYDNTSATQDLCDSGTSRCRHTPYSNITCTVIADCPIYACYTATSCTTGRCVYTTASNGAFRSAFLNTHCVDENSCHYNYRCSQGREFYSAPTLSITGITGTALTCGTNYSFSSLFTPSVNNADGAPFGAPALEISSIVVVNCPLFSVTVYQTGPLTGSILLGQTANISATSNQCTLSVTVRAPQCTGAYDISQTATITYTVNKQFVDGYPCATVADCPSNGVSTSVLTYCNSGFCAYNYPIATPCTTSSDCLYFPCHSQSCFLLLGSCGYNAITSPTVPAPVTGSYCTLGAGCKTNFRCVNGAVAFDWAAPFPTNPSPVTLRCNSTVFIRDLFAGFAFSNYSVGYKFTATYVSGSQVATFSGNDTFDLTASFSGPFTQHYDSLGNPIATTQIQVYIRLGCDGLTYTALNMYTIDIIFTCCNDGILDAGEQCDLGRQLNYTNPFWQTQTNTIYNDSPSTCCSSTCQLISTSKQCGTAANNCQIPALCSTLPAPVSPLGTCPSNTVQPNTYVCSVATTPCTFNSTCNNLYNNCSYNVLPPGSSCNSDNDLCTVETCNGVNCTYQSTINYNDGLYCNGVETCNPATGLMVAGTPPNCTSTNPCFTGSCSELLQSCVYTPIPNSTGQCGVSNVGACKYGNYSCVPSGSTAIITCVGVVYPSVELCLPGGVDENCNGVVDENCNTTLCSTNANCSSIVVGACQVAVCDTINHVCVIQNQTNGTPCNDGLACTTGDKCMNAMCVGTPVVCNDNNTCTDDTCLEPLGICSYSGANKLGFPCNADNNLCTENDSCDTQGNCLQGTPIVCNATGNQCVVNQCVPSTGLCVPVNITGPCNDGLACTVGEQCIGSQCLGPQIDCNDHIPCTNDTCIEPLGVCSNNLYPNTCYISSTCYSDGAVNPSNPCQVCNSSLSTSSWSFIVQLNVPCNDNSLCTFNDICVPALQICQGTPVDCSSFSNQCNVGQCVLGTGQCAAVPLPNGTSCEDGLFCTINDQCILGGCSAGVLRTCNNLDTSCSLGYCNETLDMCVALPLPDFTPCSLDTLVCNGNEHCLLGNCVPGTPLTCPAPTQCSYYTCQEPSGCTQYFNSSQPCTDFNVCTIGDKCAVNADVCLPGTTQLNCNDNNDCTNDFCDRQNGCSHVLISGCLNCTTVADCTPQICHSVVCQLQQCIYTALPDGSSCSDGDICNGVETCSGGTCVNPPDLNCSTTNPCISTSCNSTLGCVLTPNTSLPFNDNNVCTINDRCSSNGTGISDPYICPAPTTCLTYNCINSDGLPFCQPQAINIGGPCNDGDPCTTGEVCTSLGTCAGTPVICPAPNQCQVSISCVGGTCVPINKPNGTACQTGNLCTSDYCNGFGTCLQGLQVVFCSALDQCHDSGVCDPSTGICPNPSKPDGTPCNDGDACTQTDTCQSSTCVGSNPVHCTAIDQCHDAGVCNKTTGTCDNPILPDYTNCNLNDLCVQTAVCLTGNCTPVVPVDCSSSNPCITPECNSGIGCIEIFNTNPCNDNNDCTANTTCNAGACDPSSGVLVNCNDGNPCTADLCRISGGCDHSIIADCQPCVTAADCPAISCWAPVCFPNNTCGYIVDDSNTVGCLDSIYCNGQEFCSGGACRTGTPPNCIDSNSCTLDYCDTGIDQCVNIPLVNNSCVTSNLCALSANCDGTGACVPTSTITCPPAPPCQILIGCNPLTGGCEYAPMPDNTPCDDQNLCTQSSSCQNSVCVGYNHITCVPLDQCHLAGTCNPPTGLCSNPPAPDGTPCDDGLFCTAVSQCMNASCATISLPSCPVPVGYYDPQCQEVVCDENSDSCSIVDLPDGTTCSVNQGTGPCSGSDTCLSGGCQRNYAAGQLCRSADGSGCDVPEYCVYGQDTCPPDAKQPDGTSCPSGLYCLSAQCGSGICNANIPRDCSFLDDQCRIGGCVEALQSCVRFNKPDMTICNANITGQCIESNACITGTCSPLFSSSMTICNNGSLCTVNDHCSGNSNTCLPGNPVDCSAFDSQCTIGMCDPFNGQCFAMPKPNGTPCNADNYPCTEGDSCQNSACVQGTLLDCSYLDSPCTFGFCQIHNLTSASCAQQFNSSDCFFSNCTGGCTYGHSYWSTHTAHWPSIPESTTLCGMPWTYWLVHPHMNHYLWVELAEEYIGAKLNLYNGACQPPVLTNILLDSLSLLITCDTSAGHLSPNAANYKLLQAKLKAYNNGTFGPGHCDGDGDLDGDHYKVRFEALDYLLLILTTTFIAFSISFVSFGMAYKRGYNCFRIFKNEKYSMLSPRQKSPKFSR